MTGLPDALQQQTTILGDLFAHNPNNHPLAGRNRPTRCTRTVSNRFPESSILIYIDGSCLNQNSSIDV